MRIQAYQNRNATYQRREVIGDSRTQPMRHNPGVYQEARKGINETVTRAEKMLIEYDMAKARDVYNDFREASRTQSSALSTAEGADAIGKNSITTAYSKWYEESKNEFFDKLETPDQQDAFSKMAEEKKESVLDGLALREAKQHRVYLQSVVDKEMINARNDIILNPGSDALADKAEQELVDSIKVVYSGTGAAEIKQKAVADLRAARVRALMEASPEKAEQVLEKSKLELQGAYYSLKEELKNKNRAEKAQAYTDKISSKYPGNLEKQLSEARKNLSGEAEDDVVKRLKIRFSDAKRIADLRTKQLNDDTTSELLDLFENGGTHEEWNKIANDVIDPKAREHLLRLGESKYKKEPEVNFLLENEAYEKIDAAIKVGDQLTPEELIREYGANLTRQKMEDVLEYQRGGGNLKGLRRTEAERWFKNMTSKKADERPKAFSDYWDFLKAQLVPGKKPTVADYENWTSIWMKTPGTGIDAGFMFFNKDEVSRSAAIKGGYYSEYVPTREYNKIKAEMDANPEVAKDWISKYGSEEDAISAYYNRTKK